MPTRFILAVAVTLLAFPATSPARPKSTKAPSGKTAASNRIAATAPVAKYTVSPSQPVADKQATFTASTCAGCTYLWEDDGPDGAGETQWRLGSGKVLRFTFQGAGKKLVRLTVTSGGGKATTRKTITVGAAASPAPAPPPASAPPPPPAPAPPAPAPTPGSGTFAQPSCEPGATQASTAAQVRSGVSAGKDVCVTASVGDVDLDGLTASTVRYVGTSSSGSMGFLSLDSSSRITIRARFRSTTIRGSSFITIEQSIIGGTAASRVLDQLIFMPDTNNDVTIADNDIGWTRADDTGNTGYGCRCYGANNRLQFIRNRVHDIAADGFQGVGGSDVLIDRNEIGPVGANPSSNEHSDNIQITGNGPNLRVTNNWLHHQGYYEGAVTGNSGATYIHGGSTGSLLYENNLVAIGRGRVEFGGLGTGGTSRSNLTVRRNTFYDLGQGYTGFPGMEWEINSGSNNMLERNVGWDPDGGAAFSGVAVATVRDNLFTTNQSQVSVDADGQCTTAACNPAGQEPIGYRKPSYVHW